MKSRYAIDAVAIEQRQRRVSKRRRTLDEGLGQRRAIEKRKRGRGVQFDVHGEIAFSTKLHASSTAGVIADAIPDSSPNSINNPVEKPMLSAPRLKQPAHRAITQGDIPFVSIPWPGRHTPPGAR